MYLLAAIRRATGKGSSSNRTLSPVQGGEEEGLKVFERGIRTISKEPKWKKGAQERRELEREESSRKFKSSREKRPRERQSVRQSVRQKGERQSEQE